METDVRDESSIIFTNSARTADELQQSLKSYSVAANVITEFMQPAEIKDTKSAWNSAIKAKGMNVLGDTNQFLRFFRLSLKTNENFSPIETTFRRNGFVTLCNEMKPFYWLI